MPLAWTVALVIVILSSTERFVEEKFIFVRDRTLSEDI